MGIKTDNLPSASVVTEVMAHVETAGVKSLATIPVEKLVTQLGASLATDYATLAELQADLDWNAGALAKVWGDAVLANRGVYQKSGEVGSGAWARIGPLPETDLSRSLRVPTGESINPFPDAATRAGTVVMFDGGGQPIPGPDATDIADAQANAASAAADKVDAETARDAAVAAAASLDTSNFVRKDIDTDIDADTKWLDNRTASFGTGNDFNVAHDGTSTTLWNITGSLVVENRADGGNFGLSSAKANGDIRRGIDLVAGLATILRYDGAQKLATDAQGATISGRLIADDGYYIGKEGGGSSLGRYWDDTADVHRSFGWNDANQRFEFEDSTGAMHRLDGLGVGQSFSSPNLTNGVWYENTTGKPIFVSVRASGGGLTSDLQISSDGSTAHTSLSNTVISGSNSWISAIVGAGEFYRTFNVNSWREYS
ncbi:hypothetical protein [Labrenzia sp. DG1229]|uniref:hypothetical protein n=1 Tax=Labrenzia sp. DG1229 TaxID=681847 RepID=UPI00048ACD1B|nr:hypothetical protein [Labrenzia sp. DG1229]